MFRRTRVRRVFAALTAVAFLGISVAACGDGNGRKSSGRSSHHDDDDDDDDRGGGSFGDQSAGNGGSRGTAGLESAVREYTRAYFAAETATAYRMLSGRCQEEVTASAHASLVAGDAAEHGPLLVETFTVDRASAGSAVVTYTVGVPVVDAGLAGEAWTREGGSWRWDDC